MCGFCNVWVCVCVGYILCACVYYLSIFIDCVCLYVGFVMRVCISASLL